MHLDSLFTLFGAVIHLMLIFDADLVEYLGRGGFRTWSLAVSLGAIITVVATLGMIPIKIFGG